MTSDAQLQALGRVAQLKSDLELKKFSAFRSHVVALEGRIAAIRDEMSNLSAGDAPGRAGGLRWRAPLPGGWRLLVVGAGRSPHVAAMIGRRAAEVGGQPA